MALDYFLDSVVLLAYIVQRHFLQITCHGHGLDTRDNTKATSDFDKFLTYVKEGRPSGALERIS